MTSVFDALIFSIHQDCNVHGLFPFLESSIVERLFLEHHASHLHSGQTGLCVPKGRVATAEANTTSEKEATDMSSVPVTPVTKT